MIIIVFIFGLIVGSFLNAVIYRLHSGDSIINDRSRCVHCRRHLAAIDLIPLLSFILLRGKCRYCRRPISWQYPVVELITSLTFILFALNFEFRISNFEFWYHIVFACCFIVIAVFDLKHYLILDKIVFLMLAMVIVWNLFQGQFIMGVWGAILVSGFFGLQYWFSQGRWIGFGDVKLGLVIGAIFGWQLSLISLMLAYFSGSIVAIGLLLAGRRKLGSKLPFGTFLSFSVIITLLYGSEILAWYKNLIGF